MAQRMETTQAPTGSTSQTTQVQPSPDDIIRKKLSDALGEILTKAQEVGFELATLDYKAIDKCPEVKPLIDKSKELIISLKKLFAMRKELMKLSQ